MHVYIIGLDEFDLKTTKEKKKVSLLGPSRICCCRIGRSNVLRSVLSYFANMNA